MTFLENMNSFYERRLLIEHLYGLFFLQAFIFPFRHCPSFRRILRILIVCLHSSSTLLFPIRIYAHHCVKVLLSAPPPCTLIASSAREPVTLPCPGEAKPTSSSSPVTKALGEGVPGREEEEGWGVEGRSELERHAGSERASSSQPVH